MKKIAIIGTGVIGTMLGGFLARAGNDLTVISQFRRETAEALAAGGITVEFGEEKFTVPVSAVFADDLDERLSFDIVFITGKSNDTKDAITKLLPYIHGETIFSSLQNGINEDEIIPLVGKERVIPCVCFAGGQLAGPGYVITHDGYFIIGELGGGVTDRLNELSSILSPVKRVVISEDIMADRWGKLAEVALTVPISTISGIAMFSEYDNWNVQRYFARLASENFNVAEACGVTLKPILGVDRSQWERLSRGRDEEAEKALLNAWRRPPAPKKSDSSEPAPSPADAYTSDILRGLPLEIDYTNGYIVKKGEEHNVPVNTHKLLVSQIKEIAAGSVKRGADKLIALLEETNRFYT